jgi:Neuraminidase (sialidase)
MQRGWRPWAGCLALTAVATVFLLIGRLAAQAPGQSGGVLSPPVTPADEIEPQLLSGPNGEVFRLWRRWRDFQSGGEVLLALASPQHAWQKVLEIVSSEPGVTAKDPDVAFGSSNQVALAYQWRRHSPRTKQVRLARSDDGGRTWTQSSTPVDTSGTGFTPKLGWGRGRSLVVVWADERRERTWDIYARRSPDGGGTWEPQQLLSRFSQQTKADIYFRPEIISDGQDRFWVVWVGLRNGRSRLYLSRSADGGQTWADPVPLSGSSASVFGQRFVRSGERLLLVWQDARTGKERIYAVASGDGGVTWSSPARVDHLPADSQTSAAFPAAVLGPDGEAFAVWQDGRNGRDDIFVGRSPDGGRTWETEDARLDMDEPGTAISRFPAIARGEDGRVAVAWEDDRAGFAGIYLRVRAPGNSPAWSPEVVVTPPGQRKGAKTVSLLWGKAGALYVAWEAWDFARGPAVAPKQVDGRTLFLDKK